MSPFKHQRARDPPVFVPAVGREGWCPHPVKALGWFSREQLFPLPSKIPDATGITRESGRGNGQTSLIDWLWNAVFSACLADFIFYALWFKVKKKPKPSSEWSEWKDCLVANFDKLENLCLELQNRRMPGTHEDPVPLLTPQYCPFYGDFFF